MKAALETLGRIEECLQSMTFDVEDALKEDVDRAVVEHYKERFKLFVLDRCPAAITAYMNKANQDSSLNTITKLHILSEATKALDGNL